MAVVALMVAMLAPVIGGFGGAAARKGAVATVMGTLEQARVAALESGRDVMVVFARPNFPERDALIVLREPEEPQDSTTKYEALTRWIRLPEGILVHQPNRGKTIITASQALSNNAGIFSSAKIPTEISPPDDVMDDLAIVKFNSSGAVSFPIGDPAELKIVISEGIRGAGGTEALISEKKQEAGGFEIISLSRYTGRVQLDISTID